MVAMDGDYGTSCSLLIVRLLCLSKWGVENELPGVALVLMITVWVKQRLVVASVRVLFLDQTTNGLWSRVTGHSLSLRSRPNIGTRYIYVSYIFDIHIV